MRSRWWFVAAVGITLIVTLGSMVGRLDARPVENWDEAIHGQVSREQVARRDWLDLWYRDGYYFRKPPLSFWLRSLAILTLGDGVWALRIWSALAGLATAALLGWWAWQLWRHRWLALLAVLVFATGRFVFFHAFRTGEADGLLVFLVTLALYAYWRSWTRPRWLLLTGLATGLAVMTKSAGGLLPGLIIASHLLVTWRWPFHWRNAVGALALFLLVALPWHIIEWVRHGAQFWKDYIGLHVIERATEPIHNQGVGLFWYTKIFLQRFYPWSLWVPFAVVSAGIRWRRDRRGPEGLLLTWLLVTFLFFTLIQTKFDWYLLPLYPAAVLLVTPWLATLLRRPGVLIALAHAVSFTGLVALLPVAMHPDSVLRWIFPLSYLTGLEPNAAYLTIAVGFAIALIILLPRVRPPWLSPTVAALALAKVLFFSVGFSFLTVRAERPTTSPLPAVRSALAASRAERIYVKGVDLYRYPAAEWYLRSIRGARLIDLTREPEPEHFVVGDAVVERGDTLVNDRSIIVIERAADFRVLVPAATSLPNAVEDVPRPAPWTLHPRPSTLTTYARSR